MCKFKCIISLKKEFYLFLKCNYKALHSSYISKIFFYKKIEKYFKFIFEIFNVIIVKNPSFLHIPSYFFKYFK